MAQIPTTQHYPHAWTATERLQWLAYLLLQKEVPLRTLSRAFFPQRFSTRWKLPINILRSLTYAKTWSWYPTVCDKERVCSLWARVPTRKGQSTNTARRKWVGRGSWNWFLKMIHIYFQLLGISAAFRPRYVKQYVVCNDPQQLPWR